MTVDWVALLTGVDARIETLAPVESSLAPDDRQRATPLTVLIRELPLSEERRRALGLGMARVAAAMAESFPDNLFWDFDLLVATLAPLPAKELRERIELLVSLQHQYGALAFRYAHDFLYGYDWARWVKRDVGARGDAGPFDPVFLAFLQQRGAELVALIEQDDEKYPRLPPGKPRNPFGFSREPADERRLLAELSRRGDIPVEAWSIAARPRWDRNYKQLREAAAAELGLRDTDR